MRSLDNNSSTVVVWLQEIDSVEYGLTDIQEYYANTGALVAAAKNARQGKDVGCRCARRTETQMFWLCSADADCGGGGTRKNWWLQP